MTSTPAGSDIFELPGFVEVTGAVEVEAGFDGGARGGCLTILFGFVINMKSREIWVSQPTLIRKPTNGLVIPCDDCTINSGAPLLDAMEARPFLKKFSPSGSFG